MENHVAQDAGIIDHAVDATEGVDRRLHDALRGVKIGDAVVAGDGFAAIFPDKLHHLFRRRLVGALTGQRGADIVDDNLGTLFCHHQCNVTADPATRAGDNHNLACNNTFAHFSFSENTI